MRHFKSGDKVVTTWATTSFTGRHVPAGATGRTTGGQAGPGLNVGVFFDDRTLGVDGSGYLSIHSEDLELASEVLDWSDIEVGDTVTLRVKKTGEEFRTKAYADSDFISGTGILGVGRDRFDNSAHWEVVKIEKPKPQLPAAVGSLIHLGSREYIRVGENAWVAVFPADTKTTHRDLFIDSDLGGLNWTLVRDAGA